MEDKLVSPSVEKQASILEWEHVVLHTPTKPKPTLSRKMSLKAPDNVLFRKKIGEAAKDHEDEDEDEGK